jgi:hypothetical protein
MHDSVVRNACVFDDCEAPSNCVLAARLSDQVLSCQMCRKQVEHGIRSLLEICGLEAGEVGIRLQSLTAVQSHLSSYAA